ncbi:MAG: hypothetical protein ACR2NO_08990 [Chloroflexota bacterium]
MTAIQPTPSDQPSFLVDPAAPASSINGARAGNANGSTGPRSDSGKSIVSQNAVRHGLGSSHPVVRGVETKEEWIAFSDSVVDSLVPVGPFEHVLAERVAGYLWRLRRVPRYEAEVASDRVALAEQDAAPKEHSGIDSLRHAVENAESLLARLRRFPSLQDDAPLSVDEATDLITYASDALETVDETTLTVPGVPGSVTIFDFKDWTVRHVRDLFGYFASLSKTLPIDDSWSDGLALLMYLTRSAETDVARAKQRVADAEREADRLRRRRAFPPPKAMDKVIRYEAHLNRGFASFLHELQAAQDRRQGRAAPIARLDISADAPALRQITEQSP